MITFSNPSGAWPVGKAGQRVLQPGPALGALMILATSCALPTEEEAGKTRCETPADCPPPLICVAGRCSEELPATNDAGTTDPVDAGPTIVPSCPQTPCSTTEECFEGLCSVAAGPCDESEVPDTCNVDEICLAFGGEQAVCRRFPSCAGGVECPSEPFGSVCSTRLRPDKNPMCLPKLCESPANCPAGYDCVDVGFAKACTSGASGEPCADNADCMSNECFTLIRACR